MNTWNIVDQQRRAEREDHREHAREAPEQQAPGLIAAERQQRHEHEVLADDRRGHVDPADERRQRAHEVTEYRVH